MTYVAIYIEVQPRRTSEAIALMKVYGEASRAEAGNADLHLLQEIQRPNRFVIIEAWKDDSSFQAHNTAGHTVQFRSGLASIHLSPYDQRVHQEFAIAPATPDAESDPFCIVTHVDVPPPRKDETEVLLKTLVAQGRRDEGNVRYDVFQQNAPRTNHFTVFSIWNGAIAFALHEVQSHTVQFRESLGPMLGAPYDDRVYKYLS